MGGIIKKRKATNISRFFIIAVPYKQSPMNPIDPMSVRPLLIRIYNWSISMSVQLLLSPLSQKDQAAKVLVPTKLVIRKSCRKRH